MSDTTQGEKHCETRRPGGLLVILNSGKAERDWRVAQLAALRSGRRLPITLLDVVDSQRIGWFFVRPDASRALQRGLELEGFARRLRRRGYTVETRVKIADASCVDELLDSEDFDETISSASCPASDTGKLSVGVATTAAGSGLGFRQLYAG